MNYYMSSCQHFCSQPKYILYGTVMYQYKFAHSNWFGSRARRGGWWGQARSVEGLGGKGEGMEIYTFNFIVLCPVQPGRVEGLGGKFGGKREVNKNMAKHSIMFSNCDLWK